MKAILIDVKSKSVKEITLSSDYKEIYTHIGNGCDCFAVPVQFENADALYVDDEGLLHETIEGGFLLPGFVYPIVGNALIIGTDEEGESVDCKTDAEMIAISIRFLPQDIAQKYAEAARNQKPFMVML